MLRDFHDDQEHSCECKPRDNGLGHVKPKQRARSYGPCVSIPVIERKYPIARITRDTLTDLIDTAKYGGAIEVIVVDCRYDFEFRGGHIRGAIHFESKKQMIDMFFREIKKNVVIVFHCEFSSKRGPTCARWFRDYDRKIIGYERYPDVNYPDVYVLDEGYSKFWDHYSEYCDGGYTLMTDPAFADVLPKKKTEYERMMHPKMGAPGGKRRDENYHCNRVLLDDIL